MALKNGPAPMPVPTPQQDVSLPGPIGVPETVLGPNGEPVPFYAERKRPLRPSGWPTWQGSRAREPERVAPTFYEGDEVTFLFSMTPAALAQLQAQLSSAGLLDPDTYQPGFVGGASNDPTMEAVRVVMSYGNRAGYRSFTDAMRSYVESGFGAVGSRDYAGAEEARLAAPVSNPDDLKRVFRAAVIDTLGAGWSERDIDAMVADYQAHERAYNERVAQGEPIDEQMATPETFAEQRATAADPTGAQSQDFLEAANSLQSMLGRWAG